MRSRVHKIIFIVKLSRLSVFNDNILKLWCFIIYIENFSSCSL